MKRLLIACVLALYSFDIHAQTYTGPVVSVQDGDTFDMKDNATFQRTIRLCGVDSPEQKQPGYQKAKDALEALIRGKTVRCVQVGSGTPCDGRSRPTNRDRIVAQCFLDGDDIAISMVKSGNACDYPTFSGGHYKLDPSTCTR